MDNNLSNIQESLNFICNNYDYCWYKSRFDRIRDFRDISIVTGSSHALNSIYAHAWGSEKIVNCSMHSQDLYYDYVAAKECVKSGTRIKKCFIIMGYYIAFADLRKSEWGRMMIQKVWYPVLHDIRNMNDLTLGYLEELKVFNNYINGPSLEDIRDISIYVLSKEDNYYNSVNIRHTVNGKIWKELNDEEKDNIAINRAADHNKLEKHLVSYEENLQIFNDYISFLITENIKPIIVITPFTKEYNKYISQSSKEACMDLICQSPYKIECIDFNVYDLFNEEDFMDADHLSEIGAIKFSKLLHEKYGEK